MKRVMAWVGVLTVVLGACGSDGGGGSAGKGDTIVVGSKLDTEAQLLGQMLAQTLTAKGYNVTTKIPTGNTDITRKALESDEIDIYWEFTSSGLNLLGQKPIGDPQEAYEKVKELDRKNGIVWLPSASMNDTYALAVHKRGPIKATSLSELADHVANRPDTKLCVDPEGGFRVDVLPALVSAYGLEWTNTRQLTSELIPPAVKDGQCDVGVVYSTAALIAKNDLRILEDNKRAFGAYTPAPIVKAETLEQYPQLEKDLAELIAALDTEVITELNAKVDVDKIPAQQVARAFLEQKEII